jgi:hypothetical protein
LGLNQPAHHIDGRVMAIEQAGRGHHPQRCGAWLGLVLIGGLEDGIHGFILAEMRLPQ